MNELTISVITATYNSQNTIKNALESVSNQDYPFIEHIIIDGHSKDDTLNIINDFLHVAKVVSEPDKGIYDALNKGFRMATGDIIGILHSDDFFTNEQVLTKISDAFQTYKTDAIYGDLQYVDKEDVSKIIRYWKSGSYEKKRFLYGWMPPHPTFFVKRSIYEKYGLFDLSLKTAADYELMLRFLYKHEISVHYIPEVLVKMRLGGQSNANLMNRLKANREDQLAWKKNGIHPRFYTTLLKPTRKIIQYFKH